MLLGVTRWRQEGVSFQIHPRSFADADGDGVSDLAGITARLDHLVDLGVVVLWISPSWPRIRSRSVVRAR